MVTTQTQPRHWREQKSSNPTKLLRPLYSFGQSGLAPETIQPQYADSIHNADHGKS
jgi:hypothetical protein